MKKRFLAGIATGMFLIGMAGISQALSVSDMQLNGVDANAVAWVEGSNDNAEAINELGPYFFGSEFSLLGTTGTTPPDLSGTLDGITLSFEAFNVGDKSGTWDLTWSGIGFPVTIDIVAVLKGGNGYAAFLFDDEFLPAPGTNIPDDIWRITFNNNGGKIPDLSHMSLYARDVRHDPVPEPATMVLFGTGLVGLAGLARRKTK
jgi:hypothetical protein